MITPEHIQLSIKRALEGQSNLSPEIHDIRGFSTQTIRRLVNNLTQGAQTYMEVGLYCGATFCSSFNSNCTSIGIEDHSQDFSAGFEQVKKELKENVDKFSELAKEVYIHYEDCFKIDKSLLPSGIDMLYYDGEHSAINTAKALPYFLDNMNDTFLYMVDDVRWGSVMAGLIYGFELVNSKCDIIQEFRLYGEQPNDDPIWHNGVALFLIKKK